MNIGELAKFRGGVSVDTISELTSASGVTIDSLLIKDGNSRALAPAGIIVPYGGSSAPTGWLLCDGSAVSRTTYSDLFSAIGTTYGAGNGTTTFNVPDMIGASPAGAGTSTGYTENETITLGSKHNDQMQGHIHNQQFTQNSTGGSSYYVAMTSNAGSGAQSLGTPTQGPVSDGSSGTPRTGTTSRGKVVGVNFIIKT